MVRSAPGRHELDGWLEHRRDAMLDLVGELVRIPSFHSRGCLRVAERVELEADRLGFAVERDDADGPDGPRPTLLVWLGEPTSCPALLLNAHVDTSPPGAGWSTDPFAGQRRDGRVHGRGATLSKADVVAYLYGLACAAVVDERPRESVLLAITGDEGENGHVGPRRLVQERGLRAAAAITAGFTHAVTVAHAGVVQVRVGIAGPVGHVALIDPWQQAAGRAARLAAGLTRLPLPDVEGQTAGLRRPRLSVLQIAAGEPFAMAGGAAELLVDRRVLPEERVPEVERELLAAIEGLAAAEGFPVELDVYSRAEPLHPTPAGLALGRAVAREAAAVLGEPVPLTGTALYTDARWFGSAATPTVLFGAGAAEPVESGINGVDEWVAEDDVQVAARVVARLAARARAGDALAASEAS